MKKIRLQQEGLKLSLFDLEAEIMEIIWDFPSSIFAVGDVLEVLQQRREVAYTTVMTTVSRLYDKGLLSREKQGRKYVYCVLHTRQEYIVQLTKDVIQKLPSLGQETAISMLIDHIDDADDDELSRLEEMIRQKRLERKDSDE